ncbi:MAG: ribonuclease III [Clostridia bacterium]|nr:ribonuclease III [Clostridia bacterium]
MSDVLNFEKNICYSFNNKELLSVALTHSSYANEHKGAISNERLEFLGDKVLDLIVSTNLYRMYPDYNEGKMSKLRSEIVREKSLAKFSKKLGVDKFLKLGRSEVIVHGEQKESILSDCFEALLGAIYMDSDFSTAEYWVNSIVKPASYHSYLNIQSDSKSILQEYVKKYGGEVSYKLLCESGPEHKKSFEIAVIIDGVVCGIGKEASKKKAEQSAASKALKKMRG